MGKWVPAAVRRERAAARLAAKQGREQIKKSKTDNRTAARAAKELAWIDKMDASYNRGKERRSKKSLTKEIAETFCDAGHTYVKEHTVKGSCRKLTKRKKK